MKIAMCWLIGQLPIVVAAFMMVGSQDVSTISIALWSVFTMLCTAVSFNGVLPHEKS